MTMAYLEFDQLLRKSSSSETGASLHHIDIEYYKENLHIAPDMYSQQCSRVIVDFELW